MNQGVDGPFGRAEPDLEIANPFQGLAIVQVDRLQLFATAGLGQCADAAAKPADAMKAAAPAAKLHVHHDRGRLMRPILDERFLRGICLPNDLEIALQGEGRCEATADYKVIVDEEESGGHEERLDKQCGTLSAFSNGKRQGKFHGSTLAGLTVKGQ